MTQRLRSSIRFAWVLAAVVTAVPATALAQFGAAPAPGATQPLILPLSGRAATGVAFSGSVRPTPDAPAGVPLSLAEALRRGVEHNLGTLNLAELVNQVRGQRLIARGALLPNISSELTASRQQMNFEAMGFQFRSPFPGAGFPSVVTFQQVDARARLSQVLFDLVAWNNFRANTETVRAAEFTVQDARDAIVLAIAGTYLDVVAARARVEAVRAQLETATALQRQTEERRGAGLLTQVDVGRSQVQSLTQQQRLTSAQNDYAKQKINLARMIGLPPTDGYQVGPDVPFASSPAVALEEALRQAQESRADLKAADGHVRAAERALGASRAGRLPSATLSADYGAIGNTLPEARTTFSVVGRIRIPLWQGGQAAGVALQSEAALRQRRAELADLSSQVEADVRTAYLDLEAAASQVDVALRNQDVARQTLVLTRQRFDAGISDNVEVVQAQETVASAELDYINSVFAHNLAKVSLARAMGVAAERLPEFLRMP